MRYVSLLLAIGCTALSAQTGDAEKLAPYYPTPETIVEKMLKLGGLKAGEKMYDLGSGDGRIVIEAAQKFHAEAVGVELDKDLCKQSTAKILNLWELGQELEFAHLFRVGRDRRVLSSCRSGASASATVARFDGATSPAGRERCF